MRTVYIGIDLAWGENNPSGICALEKALDSDKLQILEIQLLFSIKDILEFITSYEEYNIHIGVDAPLVIPNESGNREIEKKFNKDFATYKISMLPVNRKLIQKFSPKLRSEELFLELEKLGFSRDMTSDKSIFEVYTHSTIAVCFNDYKILPYKRKKGRDTAFIKEQLRIYQSYLLSVIDSHTVLEEDLELLKGKKLKNYEDLLDSITCAYCIYYSQKNRVKFYAVDGMDTFVTPI